MYQLGLIGYPIQHSLSPWIHERFLDKANLIGSYKLIEIDPHASFENEIKKLKELNLNGFNVTVPYKQKIMPFLDQLDEEANAIGAVNTVVNENGKWIGYNTDGKGYIRSFKSKYPDIFANLSKRILVLGAGGAARGIYFALTSSGCERVDIANRTENSALEIARLAKGSTKTSVLSIDEAEKTIDSYDIVIQTTSVGMNPHADQSIISLDRLKKTSIVSDIVYQPIETKLLRQATSHGASVHYGHTMLLYQAQYAFEIWTNQTVAIDDMDIKLEQVLKGR